MFCYFNIFLIGEPEQVVMLENEETKTEASSVKEHSKF